MVVCKNMQNNAKKWCSQSLPVTIPAKLMAVQKTEAAPLIRGKVEWWWDWGAFCNSWRGQNCTVGREYILYITSSCLWGLRAEWWIGRSLFCSNHVEFFLRCYYILKHIVWSLLYINLSQILINNIHFQTFSYIILTWFI